MLVPPVAFPGPVGPATIPFIPAQSPPTAAQPPNATAAVPFGAAKPPKPTLQSAPGTLNGPPSGNNHAIPLSARRAEPLDLSTVERRGQGPIASHTLPGSYSQPQTPKRSRAFDIPDAPVFRPTEDEFRDPTEYIRKIAPQGSKYGIVKIVPPENWNPTFAINTEVSNSHAHSLAGQLTCAALPLPHSPTRAQRCRRRQQGQQRLPRSAGQVSQAEWPQP